MAVRVSRSTRGPSTASITSTGIPMSAMTMSPACVSPGGSTSGSFGAASVTVVAAAAQHADLAFEQVGVHRLHRGDRLTSRVFHEHERRDADVVDGALIGFAHLGGIQYAHLVAIGYQLSAISYRLSAIGYQLSAVSFRLSASADTGQLKTENLQLKADR